jgi:hypothetical protein
MRYVSKKKSERGRRHAWPRALVQARANLGVTEFRKIKKPQPGPASPEDQKSYELYIETRKIYDAMIKK